MQIIFHCLIQVPRHGIKKNSKRIFKNFKTGKPFITSSQDAKASELILTRKLTIEKIKNKIDTITQDINVAYTFFYPETVYYTKQGIRSKKVGDLSNLIETPSDALQKAKIIENDSIICSLDGSKRMPIKDNNHWLEIKITAIS